MTAWPRYYGVDNPNTTTLTLTTETVVATLPNVDSGGPGATVRLFGTIRAAIGTTGNRLEFRIRRGVDATGVQVGGLLTTSAGAGSEVTVSGAMHDTPAGELANATYVLTAVQTGATANGSVFFAHLEAVAYP